jgi:hypothetical protein
MTAVFLLAATSVFGEVIDRIMVVVENKFIITLSDIRKERVIQSALGTDLGNDSAVADSLIEKRVVDEQISQYEQLEIPEDRVTERLKAIKVPDGVTPEEIRAAVISKLRRSEFTLRRFGPFIRISDEELRKYFDEEYVPELRRKGVPVPRFEDVSEAVREAILLTRIGTEFDAWLTDLLKRTTIEKVSK